MADVLLDSDVVIWHLRGRETVVQHVRGLAARVRLGLSAITRAEVLQGMRPAEEEQTLRFLDACEVLPVDAPTADRAAALVRAERAKGRTVHLPDALIAAAAIGAGVVLHTCNERHYAFEELRVAAVPV
jgi:predicted nucleic acid-binding protein